MVRCRDFILMGIDRLGGLNTCNDFHHAYDNCTLLFFEQIFLEYLSIVHTIILCSAATLPKFLEQIFE